MSHAIPMMLVLLLLGGCATTPGTSYYYDGDGDYYYGEESADVVLDSPGAGYAGWGHGGWGYGYGAGFGHGYGWGGYGGIYSSWYYGYPPYGWWVWAPGLDHERTRERLLQRDRALRTSIVARPTIQAPLMAKPGRLQPFAPQYRQATPPRADRPLIRQSPQRASPPSAPASRTSQPAMRMAPAPARPSSHKQ